MGKDDTQGTDGWGKLVASQAEGQDHRALKPAASQADSRPSVSRSDAELKVTAFLHLSLCHASDIRNRLPRSP